MSSGSALWSSGLPRRDPRSCRRPEDAVDVGVREDSVRIEPAADGGETLPVGVHGAQCRRRLRVSLAPVRTAAEVDQQLLDLAEVSDQSIPRN